MAFGFSITSIGGLFTGRFPSCSTLAGCPSPSEPQTSGTGLSLWRPYLNKSQGVQSEWNQYIKPAIRTDMQFGQLAAYLRSGSYTTEQTACTLAEYAFVDDAGETIEDQTLCLRAYNNTSGDGYIKLFMAKKTVVDSQTTTYSTCSVVRTIVDDGRLLSFGIVGGRFLRGGKTWYAFGTCSLELNGSQFSGELYVNDLAGLKTVFGYEIPGEDFDPDYGDASTPGGYSGGTFDFHSDPAGIPAKPQYGMISPGFLNAYIVTMAGLQQFGEAIFPDLSPAQFTPTDIVSAVNFLGEIVDFLARTVFNGKLLDYIMDCHILPVTPAATAGQPVTAGGKHFVHPQTGQGYTASLISEDFTDVDCGSITTPGTFCNFLDFENCRAKLFLPFVGYVDIKNEYWHDATLGVYYRFNNIDGSFMCFVTSSSTHSDLDGVVIGQYSGNACIHIPINSRDYSNVISGLVGAVGSAALGAASGGSGVAALAAQQSISDAQSMVNSRPTFSQSNPYSGSGSIMSKRRPHLLIEFPETSFSTKYPSEFGLPLNVAKTIGSCSGYTVAVDPVLDGIPCTDAERERIRQALRNGVIIK